MKTPKLLVIFFLISGCANHYQYAPANAQMRIDKNECIHQAYDAYYKSGGGNGAMFAGGMFFGAVGAAAGSAIQNNSNTLTTADIEPMTDKCMEARGYTATGIEH